MKKSKRAAEAEQRTPSSPAYMVQGLAGIAALAAGTLAGYLWAAQPAPLGVPVPPPPQPMFKITPGATKESSLINRNLAKGWLTRLAPQPDGLPYLHSSYQSEKLQFKIRYPYGTQNIEFGAQDFAVDAVDSQAIVKIDQPLAAVKVSFPTKPREQGQEQFTADLLATLKEQGAEIKSAPAPARLPAGELVTCSYLRESPDGKYVHRLYITSIGARALVFDFMLPPEDAEQGNAYAAKIMRTFDPGPILGPLLEGKASAGPVDAPESQSK